jgi:hypothetical protein
MATWTRSARAAFLAAFVLVASAACQTAPTSPPGPSASATARATPTVAASPSPAATVDRVSGWRSDLELIVPGMDRIHPNLEHGTTLEALNQAVSDLSAAVETSTDDELMVGVARIAAMVSAEGHDGHTGLFVWGTGTYPVDSLPLRLWLFEDEVVIVDALPPYEDLIDTRIDTIEGRPIAEVLETIDPVIPRDNAQTVRLLAPRFLLIPQVLRGLGIAGDGPIAIGVTTAEGVEDVRLVEPVPMAEYNAWAGPYGLHLPADPDVLYLSNFEDDLWWQVLPDTQTLYVQYNRVEHKSPAELDELEAALTDPAHERVVLDIRHNFGGEVPALDPFYALFDDQRVDEPGRLFVITGRNTWSAGSMLLARLEAGTSATITGESMGGNPTFYGDVTEVHLPYSGLSVTVTGMLEVGVDPDDPRDTIEPDQPQPLTREDWRSGFDAALAFIVVSAP